MSFPPSCLLAVCLGLTPTGPRFVATSPDGETPSGFLTLAADGTGSVTADGKAVPFRDLVAARRADVPRPAFPRGPGLLTATGDRVPGTLLGGDGQSLRFRPHLGAGDGPEWKVPLSSAAVLWLAHPPADTPADPARYPWLDARRHDTLLLANGDVLRGTIERFVADPPAVRFKADGQPAVRTLPLAQVAAVAFDPSLARTRKPKGAYTRVVFTNGARLDVTAAAASDGRLRGKTLFGEAVQVPLADVAALDVMQGKAVYLSDLKPKKVEQSAFLGVTWPVAPDRSVKGHPLRVGPSTFDKGLGTHPQTTLTYDLGGKYRRFEAVVGIDPVTGGRGRAAVRILLDGKEQDLPPLKGAELVAVGVAGVKELKLVVGFGPAGGVQADVNWADARLIP